MARPFSSRCTPPGVGIVRILFVYLFFTRVSLMLRHCFDLNNLPVGRGEDFSVTLRCDVAHVPRGKKWAQKLILLRFTLDFGVRRRPSTFPRAAPFEVNGDEVEVFDSRAPTPRPGRHPQRDGVLVVFFFW